MVLVGGLWVDLKYFCVRTSRLILRVAREEDRTEFLRVHALSAEFFRPGGPARPRGVALEARFARERPAATVGAARGTQLRLVGLLPSGRLVGFFSLTEIVRGVFQNAYAAWAVSADAAGQGFATEGVRALLALAFAPTARGGLGLHRVQANVIPENGPSVRLAERVGFRREGLAQRYLQIAGAWRDHLMFATTAEEHGHAGA